MKVAWEQQLSVATPQVKLRAQKGSRFFYTDFAYFKTTFVHQGRYNPIGHEQKALSLWIKGATYQQIAAAGFGIASASGAWRSISRALARIPKQEADQAREAQLARLQAVRMLLRD
jgi:hypothetical protein